MIKSFLTLFALIITSVGYSQDVELPPVSTTWSAPVAVSVSKQIDLVAAVTDADGNISAVWQETDGSGRYNIFSSSFTRSSNGGQTWSDPTVLVPYNPDTIVHLKATDIAVSDNRVMVTITGRLRQIPYPQYVGVMISEDEGRTWETVDFTQNFPNLTPDNPSFTNLAVCFAGGTSWLVALTAYDSVSYIRSDDNGHTWGDPTFVHRLPGREKAKLYSTHDGNSVALNYFNRDALNLSNGSKGARVTVFSQDNGRTFGPPITSRAVTSDANGNWYLANWQEELIPRGDGYFSRRDQVVIKKSSNGGRTFNNIPGPDGLVPEIDGLVAYNVNGIAATPDGAIAIIGTAGVHIGAYLIWNYSGITSYTGNNGETWSPWERLHSAQYYAGLTTVSTKDNIVALFGGAAEPESPYSLLARTLNPSEAASANDWQLYD